MVRLSSYWQMFWIVAAVVWPVLVVGLVWQSEVLITWWGHFSSSTSEVSAWQSAALRCLRAKSASGDHFRWMYHPLLTIKESTSVFASSCGFERLLIQTGKWTTMNIPRPVNVNDEIIQSLISCMSGVDRIRSDLCSLHIQRHSVCSCFKIKWSPPLDHWTV